MEYYAKKGIPKRKLNMGIPFYGQSYTLRSKNRNTVGVPTTGPGKAGEFSLQSGFLTYNEICRKGKKEEIAKYTSRINNF